MKGGGEKKLYVKYMVCLRDKNRVKSALDKLGIHYSIALHGGINFHEKITKAQFNKLKKDLAKSGLILLDEVESALIDRIINTIVEIIHRSDKLPRVNFDDIITDLSALNSESVLKVFSDVQGMSIMQFIVIQKIERMKDLFLYDDLPMSEIATRLNYKNTQYMTAQFKKYTDLSPGYFKKLKKERSKIISQASQKSNMNESIRDAAS